MLLSEHMDKRADRIARGEIFQNVPAARANNRREHVRCHNIAFEQAKADKSDPFAYNRTASHLRNGITSQGDYHVEVGKRSDISAMGHAFLRAGRATVNASISFPMNWSHA